MTRREVGKFVVGAMLSSSRCGLAAPTARGVRFSVMLWALEEKASFDRCLEMVARAGYQGVELVGEFQRWAPEEQRRVKARMRSLGLVVDAMSGVKAGFSVPVETEAFLAQFADHLQAAKALECPQVILLSGKRIAGMSAEAQRGVAVENLKRAAEMAARERIGVVIEPIDLLENPGIFLASVSDGFEIVRAVGAPHVKVLYDLYHEQRSFGNLIEKLEKNIDLVGLIHVADVPGRHEPGTGEIDFRVIYRRLAALRYDRWIAMEFYPTGDAGATLERARMEAQAAFG